MSDKQTRLSAQERRALLAAPVYRIVGMPVVALLGLANTAIIVRETGAATFGLVALVSTITLLVPFADLGIGATTLTAASELGDPERRSYAIDVIRRSYRVLAGVAAALIVIALIIMTVDGWAVLVGFSSGAQDRWAITVAACLWAVTIPAGLGVRILIGIDRNPLATVVLMSCPAFGLAVTAILYVIGVQGIWYATSSLAGLLIGTLVGTWLALRLSGLGRAAWGGVSPGNVRRPLLAGSLWLFIVGLGLPVGLQTGRVILAHLSTPEELSSYAIMAQLYAVGWSVISTAGLAFWPIFVKRRGMHAETVSMWWRLTGAFGVVAGVFAVGLWLLGPWAARILSGGALPVSAALAASFGALLIVQSLHLPANVLLTRPHEARWQAWWTIAMAAASIGAGCLIAGPWGAVGVVLVSAAAIGLLQVIPDLAWAPRLVSRRGTDPR